LALALTRVYRLAEWAGSSRAVSAISQSIWRVFLWSFRREVSDSVWIRKWVSVSIARVFYFDGEGRGRGLGTRASVTGWTGERNLEEDAWNHCAPAGSNYLQMRGRKFLDGLWAGGLDLLSGGRFRGGGCALPGLESKTWGTPVWGNRHRAG
jgi:hypothetical protein